MRIDLNPDIIICLQREFPDFKISTTGSKPALRGGRCPGCGKKTLWTWADNPGRIQCNRTNNCNWSRTSKELYPELFEKLNERFPATPENPTATADSYLALHRGFDPDKIRGWYTQGKLSQFNADRETATVRFSLGPPDSPVMWERFVEDVIFTDKDGDKEVRNKNFKGRFGGWWWIPPELSIEQGDTVHLAEGILDAIALNLSGLKAVAIMSSGTFPGTAIKPFLGMDIEWVIALDNDATGRRCLGKHAKQLREMGEKVSAIISSDSTIKDDWNDLYRAKKLTEKEIEHYRYLGSLELAQSANDKARLIWQQRFAQTQKQKDDIKKFHHIFTFKNQTYSLTVKCGDYHIAIEEALADIPEERQDKAKFAAQKQAFGQTSTIIVIGTFTMDFLYYQKPESGEDGLMFFRINFANRAPEEQLGLPGNICMSNADFKKKLGLRAPGALFTGASSDLDAMYNCWLKTIPMRVKTIDYVGYDINTKAYVFSEHAVQHGIVHRLNKESFFQLGKTGIKSVADIKETLSTNFNDSWLPDYQRAFSRGGMVALAWWFGCLFAEQLRHRYRSYTFLAIIGRAASGKSDMIDFLWKLLGRRAETFNPTPSSISGYTREMSRKSNLPVIFNEADNEEIREKTHSKRFDWNTIKDLYEGEIGRVTGRKTQDNTVNNPKFKGGLCAVQNPQIIAEEAITTRFAQIPFDLSHHTPAGKLASNRLKAKEIEEVNGFLLHAVRHEDDVLNKYTDVFPDHVAELRTHETIKHPRIIDNHAQLMALVDCLSIVLPITPDVIAKTQTYIVEMAKSRQDVIEGDTTLVQQFWANFEAIDRRYQEACLNNPKGGMETDLCNHSSKPNETIAINLEHFHASCFDHKLPMLDSSELRRQLPSSKLHPYIDTKVVHSRIAGFSKRCLVFKKILAAY